jgi:hypothetical protein
MKRFLTRCMVLGLAVLPAQAKADPPSAANSNAGVAAVVLPADDKPATGKSASPLLSTDSCSASPCPVSPCYDQPAPEHCQSRFDVFAEYLYWSVHNQNIAYAQPFDGVGVLSVPRGDVAQVSPRYTNGFRLGAGVGVGDDGWLVGTYTYFHDTATSTITASTPFVLHSFLTFPNTTDSAGDSQKASAAMAIDLQLADLDYKWNFLSCEHVTLTWVNGFRYAHEDEKLLVTQQITGTTLIAPTISFDGGGPRTGLEGEYRIGNGLFGYTKAMASLLAGEFDGTYIERNIFTGLVGNTTIRDDRLVPILELELGFGWQSSSGRVRISGGYYVGSWFNAMTIPSLANSIQATNFTHNANNNSDNMTFDGLVGRLEFRF